MSSRLPAVLEPKIIIYQHLNELISIFIICSCPKAQYTGPGYRKTRCFRPWSTGPFRRISKVHLPWHSKLPFVCVCLLKLSYRLNWCKALSKHPRYYFQCWVDVALRQCPRTNWPSSSLSHSEWPVGLQIQQRKGRFAVATILSV